MNLTLYHTHYFITINIKYHIFLNNMMNGSNARKCEQHGNIHHRAACSLVIRTVCIGIMLLLIAFEYMYLDKIL